MLLKKYRALIVLAIAVSVIYGRGHILQINKLGFDSYEPITIASDFDAAATYYPRAKAVFEGDLLVGDFNVAEYVASPAWMSIISPIIMGNFAKLFGSMKMGMVVSDFVFPAGIFLLFYWFISLLTKRKLVALVAACFFIFGPGLPFWQFTDNIIPPIFSFPFDHIDWPKLTMPFYLLAAIFTYLAFTGKRNLMIGLAGIFAGALFFTDLYEWVTFYTGLGFLLAGFILTRAYKDAKIIGSIIAIGLAVSIGYWMNFWDLTHLPQYQDLVTRVGVERSHGLRFFTWGIYARVAVISALLSWLWRKRDTQTTAYLLAFILPIFVTLNLQVITGVVPQPDHWARPLLPFLYGALAVIALAVHERYLKRISMRWWIVSGVLLLMLLFSVEGYYLVKVGERGQTHDAFKGAEVTRAQHLMPKHGAASYRWMKDNFKKGTVVGVISPVTNLDLQLYTNTKLFLPYGLNTIAPNEEIWQRFFYLAHLYNVPEHKLKGLLTEDSEMGLYLFHNMFYSEELNSYFQAGNSQEVPPEVFEEKIVRYRDMDINNPPFKLDYVYFGPNEKALGAEDPVIQNPKLRKIYEDKEIQIYQL